MEREKDALDIEIIAYWTFTITYRDRAITYPTPSQAKEYGTEMPGFSMEDFDHIVAEATKRGIDGIQRIVLNDLLPDEATKAKTEKAELLVLPPRVVDVLIGRQGACDDLLSDLIHTTFNEKTISLRNRNKKVKRHAQQSVVFATDADRQPVFDPPDSEEYKPIVHSMNDVIHATRLREVISELVGRPDLSQCTAECNRYSNSPKKPAQCGVGFHGDRESNIVWAVRLGNSLPLHYQWFHRNRPIGRRFTMELEHGSIYFMSKKAVGNDYKKSSLVTLRHSAGYGKYGEIPI